MKILITFFSFFFLGLLILLATVDLEPLLNPENSQLGEPAVNIDTKGASNIDVDESPSLPRVKINAEYHSPESEDTNSPKPGLSRITTHQLIVTDKRETEKIVTETKIEQPSLQHQTDKTPASPSLGVEE